eukprot:11089922-Lingulodinium_polyedra.AAC.1
MPLSCSTRHSCPLGRSQRLASPRRRSHARKASLHRNRQTTRKSALPPPNAGAAPVAIQMRMRLRTAV